MKMLKCPVERGLKKVKSLLLRITSYLLLILKTALKFKIKADLTKICRNLRPLSTTLQMTAARLELRSILLIFQEKRSKMDSLSDTWKK